MLVVDFFTVLIFIISTKWAKDKKCKSACFKEKNNFIKRRNKKYSISSRCGRVFVGGRFDQNLNCQLKSVSCTSSCANGGWTRIDI